MNTKNLKLWVRLLVAVGGVLLLVMIKLPMWRIELSAPQYPEGLVLKIFPGKLGGDVEIVNGLNHYIGMRTLHAKDFIEFTVLPYLLALFGIGALVVALLNKTKGLYIYTALLMLFAIVALADFWRWEYDYGHHLDPHAAIQVPGMTYQPPFLGYKQLLNFGAYSIPDAGGWIFASVGALMLGVTIAQAVLNGRRLKQQKMIYGLVTIALLSLNSCSQEPVAINVGHENCEYCKMTIADARFGAEIVSKKGKVFKFDDIQCMLNFIKQDKAAWQGADYYVTDFGDNHLLRKASESMLLHSEELRSPMNGNFAAFSSKESLTGALARYGGSQINWDSLLK